MTHITELLSGKVVAALLAPAEIWAGRANTGLLPALRIIAFSESANLMDFKTSYCLVRISWLIIRLTAFSYVY